MRKVSGKVNTGSKGTVSSRVKPARNNGVAARRPISPIRANGHSRTNGVAPVRAPAPPPSPAAPEFFATDTRFAVYERALFNKRAELLGALDESKFDTVARLGRVAEEDQAQISHEEFISLRRNSMDYQSLRLVDGAIERIRHGDYGICGECEEPISEKRLTAIPWAKFCVHCQEQQQAVKQAESWEADSW